MKIKFKDHKNLWSTHNVDGWSLWIPSNINKCPFWAAFTSGEGFQPVFPPLSLSVILCCSKSLADISR